MDRFTSTLLRLAALLITLIIIFLVTGCATITAVNTILDDPETERIMHFTNFMMMPLE